MPNSGLCANINRTNSYIYQLQLIVRTFRFDCYEELEVPEINIENLP